jgi:hypothetical protein
LASLFQPFEFCCGEEKFALMQLKYVSTILALLGQHKVFPNEFEARFNHFHFVWKLIKDYRTLIVVCLNHLKTISRF